MELLTCTNAYARQLDSRGGALMRAAIEYEHFFLVPITTHTHTYIYWLSVYVVCFCIPTRLSGFHS